MSHYQRNPLLLPELLNSILDFIAPDPVVELGDEHKIRIHVPSTEERQAFFALAQTCRATSEPALDRLWRSLDSLVPLVRCFTEAVDADTLPSPAEWATIHRYAIRVREFCMRSEWDSTPALECLLSSETILPPCSLLPNLRVLILNVEEITPHHIKPFLTPTLVSLDIKSTTYSCLPQHIVEPLSLFCPNLKAFAWSVSYRDDLEVGDMDAFCRSLHLLGKIENLQIFFPFNHMIPKNVILSPNFKVFSAMVPKIDIAPKDTPFSNVEILHLRMWNLDLFTSLLRPYQQIFRVVKFDPGWPMCPPDTASLFSCFHALAATQRTKSLESFDLIIPRSVGCSWNMADDEAGVLENDPTHHCVTYETLSPLTSFSCLRRLVIELNNQISLDDDELENLAHCWPSIETLRLSCRSGGWPWALAKYPTLHGLLKLISALPQLRQLSMPIDARIVPMDASANICNRLIFKVEFYDSLISDPGQVVDFLLKHLPGLIWVSSPLYPPTRGEMTEYLKDCREMWENVHYEIACRYSSQYYY